VLDNDDGWEGSPLYLGAGFNSSAAAAAAAAASAGGGAAGSGGAKGAEDWDWEWDGEAWLEVEEVEVPVHSMMEYHALTQTATRCPRRPRRRGNSTKTAKGKGNRVIRRVPSTTAAALYSSLSPRGGSATTRGLFSQVWQHLLLAKDDLGHVASYRFDLVDVAREVVSAAFSTRWSAFKADWQSGSMNSSDCAGRGAELLAVIDDYDTLLSSDTNFMLGRWIGWARHSLDTNETQATAAATGAGTGESTGDWLERNARNQITLWGPEGEINDYAKKEWGGLVRDYYKKRWALLIKMATETLERGSGKAWDQGAYNTAVFEQVEAPWSNATAPAFPSAPEHELLDIIEGMYVKYAD
jgi:hypothetical protein